MDQEALSLKGIAGIGEMRKGLQAATGAVN
jgi:hypothetical protein